VANVFPASGISRMLEIVTDITEGRGKPEQVELLEELGNTVTQASLCAWQNSRQSGALNTALFPR